MTGVALCLRLRQGLRAASGDAFTLVAHYADTTILSWMGPHFNLGQTCDRPDVAARNVGSDGTDRFGSRAAGEAMSGARRFNHLRDGASLTAAPSATIRAEADRSLRDEGACRGTHIVACGMVESPISYFRMRPSLRGKAQLSAGFVRFKMLARGVIAARPTARQRVICKRRSSCHRSRKTRHYARRRRALPLATTRWLDRRHRQRAYRLVSSARYARRNFSATRLHRRNAARLRWRGGIERGADCRCLLHSLHHDPGTQRRERHRRRRLECDRERR